MYPPDEKLALARDWVSKFATQCPGLFDYEEGVKCFLAGWDAREAEFLRMENAWRDAVRKAEER